MIPRVVGMSLGDALSALEAAGAPAPEIETAAAPSDFRGRGQEDVRRKTEFVATQWESPGGGLRLRVVSVPSEPKTEKLGTGANFPEIA